MGSRELMDKYPEEFKKIGAILFALSRIDIVFISVLTCFFSEASNGNSEKRFIFNDALFDENIFTTFETKRRLLIKIIKNIARVAEEKKIRFDKEKFLKICESVKGAQKIRNKVSHKILSFSGNGKVSYQVRKTNEERIADQCVGKFGTTKNIEIDLEEEFKKVEVIEKECEVLYEFLGKSYKIQN